MEDAPPLEMTFYALATYFYSTQQLKKNETIRFKDEDDLKNEINQYCAKNWEDIVKDGNNEIDYLHNYCFALNYMFMNLRYVYKFEGKMI